MRKLRIFLAEIIGAPFILGWLFVKYPDTFDRVIPYVALAVLWHLTWELFDTEYVKSRIVRRYGTVKRKPMAWVFAILLGLAISIGYMWSINRGLAALAATKRPEVKEAKSENSAAANESKPPAAKYPQFGGEITAVSTGSMPNGGGTLLVVGGTITHSLGPSSALMDWEVDLEFGHKKIIGEPIQKPERDRVFPAAGESAIELPQANYWPSKCVSPIAPGDVVIGWIWAAFPTLTAKDIYVKDAVVSVGFRDALRGKWHHIRRLVPPKGVHVPPSI